MSGIAGIIRFEGEPVELGLVQRMTSAMSHRGRDGIRHWVKGSVGLGHCMLQTTEESLEEVQPLANESENVVLVMDGWLSNWEELRVELLSRGAKLRTRADAELVLRAYEAWGPTCLSHMDGDFALVIWDANRRAAFCARDRIGIKPFYYHWNGKEVIFASEVGPILRVPGVSGTCNRGMLAEVMAAEWYSRDETLWADVMRLVPAHCMQLKDGKRLINEYWQPRPDEILPYQKEEDYFEHYRHVLFDVVRRHSRANKPIACEVSGGLDSSAVFAAAVALRSVGRLPAPDVTGLTIAFDQPIEANEIAYARAVSDHVGVPVEEIAPTFKELSWYKTYAKRYWGFPGYPNAVMHIGLLENAALKGCRVLMDGLGGDDCLQGSYYYYHEELSQGNWRQLSGCFQNDIRVFGFARSAWWFGRYGLLPMFPAIETLLRRAHRLFVPRAEAYWLSPVMQKKLNLRRSAACFPTIRSSFPRQGQRNLSRTLQHPFMIWAMELLDQQVSLLQFERRHPLYATAFVQLAFSTPERFRLRGGIMKYCHRQSLGNILPKVVTERADKAEFSSTYVVGLASLRDALVDFAQARTDLFDREGVSRLSNQLDKNNYQSAFVAFNILGCMFAEVDDP